MKAEDLERLKEICVRAGFTIITGSILPKDSILVEVAKKDIWDGVEFAKCINNGDSRCFTVGRIYPLLDVYEYELSFRLDDEGTRNGWDKEYFKPSTEQAYIEQLKKEAYDRFGKIKKYDKFQCVNSDYVAEIFIIDEDNVRFEYDKESDSLLFNGFLIYEKGKWSKKIERIKVKPDGGNIDSGHFYFVMNNTAKDKCREIGCWNVTEFLSSQLEQFLNEK
jgi:hypothetical protein